MVKKFTMAMVAGTMSCVAITAEAGRFYLAPQVGWIITDSAREADFGVEDGLSGRLTFGAGLNDWLALEAMAFTAALEANNNEEKGQYGGGLGLLLKPLGGKGRAFQPHFSFGGGLSRVQIAGGGWASNPMAEAGLGATWQFSNQFGLRGDFRYRHEWDDESLPGVEDQFQDLELMLGLNWAFGGDERRVATKELVAKPQQEELPVVAPPEPEPVVYQEPVQAAAQPILPQELDSDGDGVFDSADRCPNSGAVWVNPLGCAPVATQELCRAHFWSSSATITKYSGGILKRCVGKASVTLAESPTRLIFIRGMADPTGDAQSNLTLAQRRAAAVATFLSDHGISADRIRIQSAEVASSTTRSPKALKTMRRVEVWLAE